MSREFTRIFGRTPGYFLRSAQLALRRILSRTYVASVFRARCESGGPRWSVCYMPYVTGPVRMYIGADVAIKGKMRISSRLTSDYPALRIGNHVIIGDEVTFVSHSGG